MATKNQIGKTIYVGLGLPLANTAVEFAKVAVTKAVGMVSGPQLGTTNANIDVPDVETGFTQGLKGAASGVDTQMTFRDPGLADGAEDPGQKILREAAESADGFVTLKIVRGTGVNGAPKAGDPVEYAQGYVHSYARNPATVDSYEGFTVNFRQNATTVLAKQAGSA